jgi:hypothetical protein
MSKIELYEALTAAPDEKTRARLIAEAFERLEERYPHLPDSATQGHLRETELRLQQEIEQLRAELKADIEKLRADLTLDIERLRGEVRTELARSRVELLKWLVPLMLAQIAAIAALVELL